MPVNNNSKLLFIDFAHPKGVPGHPFKGAHILSTGQLEHPDMKRFEINTSVYFKPVAPCKNPYGYCALPPAFVPYINREFANKRTNNILNYFSLRLITTFRTVISM